MRELATTVAGARDESPPDLDMRNDRPMVAAYVAALGMAFALGTQYAAWRFAFHPHLGVPLVSPHASTLRTLRIAAVLLAGTGVAAGFAFRRTGAAALLGGAAACAAVAGLGPWYAPWALVVWQIANARNHATILVFRVAWTIVGASALGMMLAMSRGWRHWHSTVPSDSHGSTHWGDGATLRAEKGLLLGLMDAKPLRYAGEGHVLTVAPTRSGKGVSSVIPNLLDHPGSVLVTDPKGENYEVTARWRREELGQEVYAFDPFDVVGGTGAFNPLDLVDAQSQDAIDDVRMVADMLVMAGEGREGEQAFWNEEARGVLTGLVLHVAATAPPELRTLTYVRTLLTLPPSEFAALLAEMRDSEAAGGLVARAAARLLQKAEKERSGVISTAQSHTHFLDSPRMARVLGRSAVDLSTLKHDAASVYLVLPSDRLDGYARWLRLMIACALLAIQRVRGQPRDRVLFLLDEFAHLGRMQPVVRDIGLAGGYGLSFWLVIQDFSQLRSTYGDAWPTFLANVDVLQAFGTNDWDTAEYLSKMTGEKTIQVASQNESRGVSHGRSSQSQRGSAQTLAEKGRRLLFADEVRRLSASSELLFTKASVPVLAQRVSYLADPVLSRRADKNPLYRALLPTGGVGG